MLNNKVEEIIHYLDAKNEWVKCKELATYLDVSERQIRKYIAEINSNNNAILSSKQGYKINNEHKIEEILNDNVADTKYRQDHILQRLITNSDGCNIFDLADELYVSESTIQKDIASIKETLSKYKIDLSKKKDVIKIIASEKSLRKLMYSLVSTSFVNDGFFNANFSLFGLDFNFEKISLDLKEIINKNNAKINDFALNNLVINFVIIVIRIKNGFILKEENNELIYPNDSQCKKIVREINEYAIKNFNCHFADNELLHFALDLSNSVNRNNANQYDNLTLNNIGNFAEQKYIDITLDLIHKAEENYYLPPFKDKFITKFILHIQNLFYRVNNNYYVKNPLTDKIKKAYPLIYDIAVFIAQQLDNEYSLKLNEDEISFISFHIGAYFEENSYVKATQVNCAFIYSEYYDFYQITIDKLKSIYGEKISFKIICPVSDFNFEDSLDEKGIDFVIASTLSKSKKNIPEDKIIYIKPFLREDDYAILDKKINKISFEKTKKELNSYILTFFNSSLFYYSPSINNKYELIKNMCDDLYSKKCIDRTFYDDVIKRENLSSTAFHDVAVPHSFSSSGIKRSFISVALFPKTIEWNNNQKVKIVALIGINKNSRVVFSQFFEHIINILDSPENIASLISNNSFDSFYKELERLFNI